MAKFKTYDYRQRVLLPVSLEDQLMSGTLEFAIHTLVEKRLDLTIFAGKYRNDATGRAAYDPKIILKVACGQQPDHSTKGRMTLPSPGPPAPAGNSWWRSYKKKAELIKTWLAENQPKQGAAGREKQGNITDNESAKMMTSHGAVQGYNSQALIDAKHQVIVHGEVFGDGQDHGHVPPMLAGALENLQSLGHEVDYFKGKVLTADSNYHTQINLKECRDLGLDAYIPDRKFRNRDPRFATQKRQQARRFTLKDFHYEEGLDQYICPQGKILKLLVKRVLDHGHLYRKYIAAAKDCQTCPLKSRCIYGKGGKRKHLAVPIGESLSKQMVEKIDTEEGRRIYPNGWPLWSPFLPISGLTND